MVLKLYGYPRSSCTRLVALICKEKEIPYELVPVDLAKGEHKTPGHREFQPFGQVPYIDDDGFILYESLAIARYLIKKYPNQGTLGLVPTDPKEEALFEQASSVEVSNFNAHVKQYRSFKTDEGRAAEYLKRLEDSLDVYDIILGKQKYVAGDTLTLADLQHLPKGSAVFTANLGHLFADRHNVERWWNDISGRPTWLSVKNGA